MAEVPQFAPEVILCPAGEVHCSPPTPYQPLWIPKRLSGYGIRTFPVVSGSEIAFWSKSWVGTEAKVKVVLTCWGRVVAREAGEAWETKSPPGPREKSPSRGSLRGGRLRQPPGSFGSFRQFQLRPSTTSARCAPHPTPPGSFGAPAILHEGTISCPTRPHVHLLCSLPILPIPSLPRSSQSPDIRAPSTRVPGPAGSAKREGPVHERSGNPTDWRRLSPRASRRAAPRLAGRLTPPSRTGWLQRPRARRAEFAPARARALCAGWPARTRPSGLRGGAKSSSPGEVGVDPLALRPPAAAAIPSPPPGRGG